MKTRSIDDMTRRTRSPAIDALRRRMPRLGDRRRRLVAGTPSIRNVPPTSSQRKTTEFDRLLRQRSIRPVDVGESISGGCRVWTRVQRPVARFESFRYISSMGCRVMGRRGWKKERWTTSLRLGRQRASRQHAPPARQRSIRCVSAADAASCATKLPAASFWYVASSCYVRPCGSIDLVESPRRIPPACVLANPR